jgi:cytochrome b561
MDTRLRVAAPLCQVAAVTGKRRERSLGPDRRRRLGQMLRAARCRNQQAHCTASADRLRLHKKFRRPTERSRMPAASISKFLGGSPGCDGPRPATAGLRRAAMTLLNTQAGYGALSKLLHWAVVVLFAFQYAAATIMLNLGPNETWLGLRQDDFFNWHKSLGLIALAVALVRLLARKAGRLPDWAPTLSARERAFMHHAEPWLYAAMFVMPVSGYVYVMAGGYGVILFGVFDLPNPIGKWQALAVVAQWTHIVSSYVLLCVLAGHIGLVLRHQWLLGDNLLLRMLAGSRAKGP